MLHIKEGVRIQGLRPEMMLGIYICDQVFALSNYDCTITSCAEESTVHGFASLHYSGCAVDLRTKHLAKDADEIIKRAKSIVRSLKAALGASFDVVLEKDHIHVEYQPKRP